MLFILLLYYTELPTKLFYRIGTTIYRFIAFKFNLSTSRKFLFQSLYSIYTNSLWYITKYEIINIFGLFIYPYWRFSIIMIFLKINLNIRWTLHFVIYIVKMQLQMILNTDIFNHILRDIEFGYGF